MCGTGWMLGDWPRWDMDDVELILASDNARTLRFRSAQALSLWDLGTIVCHLKLRQCGSFAGVMELRTSVSSVFSARTDFLSRFPRFHLTLTCHVSYVMLWLLISVVCGEWVGD